MSTNSTIGYVREDGKVVSAYCHWDGYPSHNGKILLKNYNTLERVKELVDEGDMSSLGARCHKPKGHSYETPVEGVTVYYGRDRGEKKVGCRKHANADKFFSDREEYNYLFIDGKWYFTSYDEKDINLLTPKICK